MRLTQFTDYGLRILMVMARQPERLFSTAELAQSLSLSRHHLQKIVQTLAEAEIVTTQRGIAGGVMLAKPPSAFRLGNLVEILERDQSLVECLGTGPCQCTIAQGCRLKARLRRAEKQFIKDLNETTLLDIALPAKTDLLPAE